MRPCLRFLMLLIVAGLLPVLCYSDEPAPDELETNARALERYKSDPEHYGRLQTDLRAFWQLSPDTQERLRQLDRQLHDTDSITQKRLWGVMERYSAWLERLPEADRQRILNATDRYERMQIIKQLTEEQWLKRQPQKVQEKLAALPEAERRVAIAKERTDERQRMAMWSRTLRARSEGPGGGAQTHVAKPARVSDFPPDTQIYLNELWKTFSTDEKEHLKMLEGTWPYFTRVVLESADKHPLKLPGPSTGIVTRDKLPKEYREALGTNMAHRELRLAAGKWPDFAIEATKIARHNNPQLAPLGPSHPGDFLAPVKQFIEGPLTSKLNATQKEELHAAEGKWPEYPRLVMDLAAKHDLEVPLMRMPNSAGWWDKIRDALPEVPDRVLRDFAMNDLSPEERKQLQLTVGDPTSRDRLVQEYFKKNPHEKKRLERLDHQLFLNGGKPAKTKPGL